MQTQRNDSEELAVMFEALRDYAEKMEDSENPSGRMFLLMLADRGDALALGHATQALPRFAG